MPKFSLSRRNFGNFLMSREITITNRCAAVNPESAGRRAENRKAVQLSAKSAGTRTVLKRLFQPLEGLFFVVRAKIDDGKQI